MPTPIDVRTYLVLEAALQSRLTSALTPIIAQYHADIADALQAKNYSKAYELAGQLDLEPIYADNKEFIKYVLLACINFGAQRVVGNVDTVVAAGDHSEMLDRAVRNLSTAIEFDTCMRIQDAALQLIASAKQVDAAYVLVQKFDPSEYVGDFQEFATGGFDSLKIISSQHTSRLATWGFVAEAEVEGVTQYKVTAVLDGRTSDFCRMMNGHVFEVEDARKRVNDILALETPDEIAVASPWPSQNKAAMEEYRGWDAADFVAAGLHIPPYHPHCRTLLTMVKSAPRLAKPPQQAATPTIPDYQASQQTFEELGLHMTPQQVEHWNNYIGKNPVEVLAKMTNSTPEEVLAGILIGNVRSIVVQDNGNLQFKLQKELEDGGSYKAQFSLNPYDGALYQHYLDLKETTAPATAQYLAELYNGIGTAAIEMGLDSFTVVADSASAALYAKAGFLPSPAAWFDFKENALEKLATLDGDPEEIATLTDILNSKDETGFFALTQFDSPLVADLLSVFPPLELTVALTDANKLALYKDTFP